MKLQAFVFFLSRVTFLFQTLSLASDAAQTTPASGTTLQACEDQDASSGMSCNDIIAALDNQTCESVLETAPRCAHCQCDPDILDPDILTACYTTCLDIHLNMRSNTCDENCCSDSDNPYFFLDPDTEDRSCFCSLPDTVEECSEMSETISYFLCNEETKGWMAEIPDGPCSLNYDEGCCDDKNHASSFVEPFSGELACWCNWYNNHTCAGSWGPWDACDTDVCGEEGSQTRNFTYYDDDMQSDPSCEELHSPLDVQTCIGSCTSTEGDSTLKTLTTSTVPLTTSSSLTTRSFALSVFDATTHNKSTPYKGATSDFAENTAQSFTHVATKLATSIAPTISAELPPFASFTSDNITTTVADDKNIITNTVLPPTISSVSNDNQSSGQTNIYQTDSNLIDPVTHSSTVTSFGTSKMQSMRQPTISTIMPVESSSRFASAQQPDVTTTTIRTVSTSTSDPKKAATTSTTRTMPITTTVNTANHLKTSSSSPTTVSSSSSQSKPFTSSSSLRNEITEPSIFGLGGETEQIDGGAIAAAVVGVTVAVLIVVIVLVVVNRNKRIARHVVVSQIEDDVHPPPKTSIRTHGQTQRRSQYELSDVSNVVRKSNPEYFTQHGGVFLDSDDGDDDDDDDDGEFSI